MERLIHDNKGSDSQILFLNKKKQLTFRKKQTFHVHIYQAYLIYIPNRFTFQLLSYSFYTFGYLDT